MNKIETKFYDYFISKLDNYHGVYYFGHKQKYDYKIKAINDYFEVSILNNDESDCFSFQIEPQPREDCFEGYIPDFAIYMNGLFAGFVIEIDGYEFHKTKEQAKIDREKDRCYLLNNYIPIRFTGYDVYHHTDICFEEIIKIILCWKEHFTY